MSGLSQRFPCARLVALGGAVAIALSFLCLATASAQSERVEREIAGQGARRHGRHPECAAGGDVPDLWRSHPVDSGRRFDADRGRGRRADDRLDQPQHPGKHGQARVRNRGLRRAGAHRRRGQCARHAAGALHGVQGAGPTDGAAAYRGARLPRWRKSTSTVSAAAGEQRIDGRIVRVRNQRGLQERTLSPGRVQGTG